MTNSNNTEEKNKIDSLVIDKIVKQISELNLIQLNDLLAKLKDFFPFLNDSLASSRSTSEISNNSENKQSSQDSSFSDFVIKAAEGTPQQKMILAKAILEIANELKKTSDKNREKEINEKFSTLFVINKKIHPESVIFENLNPEESKMASAKFGEVEKATNSNFKIEKRNSAKK